MDTFISTATNQSFSNYVIAGSAMSIGPTLLPIFQQMGIYDEIVATGKYGTHTYSYRESLKPYRPQDYRPIEEL